MVPLSFREDGQKIIEKRVKCGNSIDAEPMKNPKRNVKHRSFVGQSYLER